MDIGTLPVLTRNMPSYNIPARDMPTYNTPS